MPGLRRRFRRRPMGRARRRFGVRRPRFFRKRRMTPRRVKSIVLRQSETKKSYQYFKTQIQGQNTPVTSQLVELIDLNNQLQVDVNNQVPASGLAGIIHSVHLKGYKLQLSLTNQQANYGNTFYSGESITRFVVISSTLIPNDLGIPSSGFNFSGFTLLNATNAFGMVATVTQTPDSFLDLVFDTNKCNVLYDKKVTLKPAFSGQGVVKRWHAWIPYNRRVKFFLDTATVVPTVKRNLYLLMGGTTGGVGLASVLSAQVYVNNIVYYRTL